MFISHPEVNYNKNVESRGPDNIFIRFLLTFSYGKYIPLEAFVRAIGSREAPSFLGEYAKDIVLKLL